MDYLLIHRYAALTVQLVVITPNVKPHLVETLLSVVIQHQLHSVVPLKLLAALVAGVNLKVSIILS